jgi:hypothetical protein
MNNIVRRILGSLALVVALAPVAACTFGAFPRESMDPARHAIPPCFSGDVCALGFDNRSLGWTVDVIASTRH